MDTQPLPQVPPPPGPPGPVPKKRRTWLIVAAVCGVLFLSVCLCGLGSALGLRGKGDSADPKPATPAASESLPPSARPSSAPPSVPPDAAAVPDLVGQRLQNAQDILTAAGFKKIKSEDATGDGRLVINSKNWLVQSQSPAAGTKVAKGTTVTLKVRKPSDGQGTGPVEEGTVPAVICKDLQSAQDTLQAAGFRDLGSEDGTGKGRLQVVDRNWLVIAQSAAAGSRPPVSTRIVLTVVKYGEPTGSSGCKS